MFIGLLLLIQLSIYVIYCTSFQQSDCLSAKTIKKLGFNSPKKLCLNMVDDLGEKLVYDKKQNRLFEADLNIDSKADEFTYTDKETGEELALTREEKERIFLDAIQSYYYSGKQILDDKQFNRLREDLTWEGSVLVTLSRNETLFVNAIQSYNKGTPVLTDSQFDELKSYLKETNSKLAVSNEPKCYVDTGVCKVTWEKDVIRTLSLSFPAVAIVTLLYLGIFYELLALIDVSANPLLLLLAGSYPIYLSSDKITKEIFFKDPLVAAGKCPNCGVENKVFFGGVLGIEGDVEESSVKCTNCKTNLTIKRSSLRVSTLLSTKKPGPSKAVELVD